jgi:hypothetical protein
MNPRARPFRQVSTFVLGFAAVAALAQVQPQYRNVTAGGPLRPGVYGRIELRGAAAPPPLIYSDPVVANETIERVQRRPVYLYVPPGQVRKWKRSCAKWRACDVPVLFVRIDHSPSQWGAWRHWREEYALHHHGDE